jgi:hypothetical protein
MTPADPLAAFTPGALITDAIVNSENNRVYPGIALNRQAISSPT